MMSKTLSSSTVRLYRMLILLLQPSEGRSYIAVLCDLSQDSADMIVPPPRRKCLNCKYPSHYLSLVHTTHDSDPMMSKTLSSSTVRLYRMLILLLQPSEGRSYIAVLCDLSQDSADMIAPPPRRKCLNCKYPSHYLSLVHTTHDSDPMMSKTLSSSTVRL